MSTASTTPARTRRAVNTADVKPAIPASMHALAAQYHEASLRANEAKKKAENLREKLLAAMTGAGVTAFESTGALNVPLVVAVAAPVSESIDCAKLRTLVTDTVFMACVSATKKSVTEHAGLAVVAACAVNKEGEKNVTVKVKKG